MNKNKKKFFFKAMRWPLFFRNKSPVRYVFGSLAVGLVLGLVDVGVELALGVKPKSVGCAAIGCFVSPAFRTYWGATNTVSQAPSTKNIIK
jgi:hypothetical protein